MAETKIKMKDKSYFLKDLVQRPGFLTSGHIKTSGRLEAFALFAEETRVKYSGYIAIEQKRVNNR